MSWFDDGGNGAPVEVAAMLDSKAADIIQDMIQFGALISIGLTSDGGALGVTVTVDGKWRREYFRDGEQLTLWVEEALEPVRDACEARRASSDRGKRIRSVRGR